MRYKNSVIKGIFRSRPNRFIAIVEIKGVEETVHVKNTGRCRELLIDGVTVLLESSDNPNRKTKFSLIAVYKDELLINMDSQIPNAVVYEAIENGKIKELSGIKVLKREKTYKNSRFDLYYETETCKGFIEVKGVTLEAHGAVKFPDAPTTRGSKHIKELIDGQENNYTNYIFFLVQFQGGLTFSPNDVTDPKFGENLRNAKAVGVGILCYDSIVTEESIEVNQSVEVKL